MKKYFDFYVSMVKIAIIEQFQYSVATAFYMIGMLVEPIIYLVVWSTIARQMGGSVGGYTAGAFATYYIVWTLVRNMNIVFTPYGWEGRIKYGQLSMMLMKPIHPIHNDVAYLGGMKVVMIAMWVPIAVLLSLFFKPTLEVTWLKVVVFFFAIWGAYLIRTMLLSILGLITFWTTRVSAVFELYFGLELILSGRLVPMSLMPVWVQNVSVYLPFKWTFFFPIQALAGNMSTAELLGGLGMQVVWILIGLVGLNLFWKIAVREYSAVGG
jgi:ABC-2 type transport system permease protein